MRCKCKLAKRDHDRARMIEAERKAEPEGRKEAIALGLVITRKDGAA